MLRDLKELGASNAAVQRNRGLTGKEKYKQLQQASTRYRNRQGLFESTYEIVYGHAWAPKQINLAEDAGVAVPVSQLFRR